MNVVEFKNVYKKRKGFALEDLNLTIPKGFITGFIGPNGSGKTTTIQMMMDILQLDAGEINIFGASHKDHKPKQNIGFVYDELYIYDEFNIQKMKSVIAPIYETWNEELFQKYLDIFELPTRKKIKRFSKGMKMKCSLLFALSHEPEFIVMDEPTSSLDPIFRRELLEILQELMVRENQTIFISTHITNDLDRIADYVIFIYQGKILFQKSMEEIRQSYFVIQGKTNMLDADTRALFTGLKENSVQFSGLYNGNPTFFHDFKDDFIIEQATLEDMMYFMTRKEQ